MRYEVDPNNPYPNAYTGHLRVTTNAGKVHELRQPHFRGGAEEPLTMDDLVEKFRGNARYGGWDTAKQDRWLAFAREAFSAGHISLEEFRG